MGKAEFLLLACVVACVGLFPGCGDDPQADGDGDTDTDTDGDADADSDGDEDMDAQGDADADSDGDTDIELDTGDAQSDGDVDGGDGDADTEPDAGCGSSSAPPDCDAICTSCGSIIPGDAAMCPSTCGGLEDAVASCMTDCASQGSCQGAAMCISDRATADCEEFCESADALCPQVLWQMLPREDCADYCGAFSQESQDCFFDEIADGDCDVTAFPACFSACADDCPTAGATQCGDGEWTQTCTEGADGCNDWVDTTDCAESDQVCDDSGDEAGCEDICMSFCPDEGATQCGTGEWVQTCTMGAEDCTDWVNTTDCAESGRVCDDSGADALCTCPPGWTGEACDMCLITVDGDSGDDENTGRGWDNAVERVQTALSLAADDGCEIWVASGTYYPTDGADREATFQLVSYVELYGGFVGDELHREDRDPLEHVTTLSGDIDRNDVLDDGNSYHVVTGADNALIDGFTITGGHANETEEPHDCGGGMYNYRASPEVIGCTFEGNHAYSFGGGMYNTGAFEEFTSPQVIGCTFMGNSADYYGAGMGNVYSSPRVELTTFTNNREPTNGGGMANSYSEAEVINCDFIENGGRVAGGGIYNVNASPTVVGCTFLENRSRTGDGGGIANTYGSMPLVTRCTFEGNTASGFGGGVYNYSNSDATITSCAFVENGAGHGGGIGNEMSLSPSVTGCLFLRNTASHSGGGVSNVASGGVISSSTFYGNSGHYMGGAILNSASDPIVATCILWGNTAPEGAEIHNNTATPAVQDCDISGGYPGPGNIDADPLFVNAPEGDLRLRVTPSISPCIDAVLSAGLPEDVADLDGDGNTTEPTPLDLDDQDRVRDGDGDGSDVLDMGAYEHQPVDE